MASYLLPNRSFLRLSGPDSERYLNGQITQKVSETHDNKVLWTGVTNAKGGLEGVACIRRLSEGEYLLDCPKELGDLLEERLDKYLIADDCEWTREDSEWSIIVGEELNTEDGKGFDSFRYRNLRKEMLLNERASNYPNLPASIENKWCALNAVPRWGIELKTGMLPAEGGLHDLALSFDKGCYIGQEIISRMKTSGKSRTRLYQIISKNLEAHSKFTTFYESEDSNYALQIDRKVDTTDYPSAMITTY